MKRRSNPYLGIGALLLLINCGGIDNVGVTATARSTVPAATPLEVALGQMGFGEFATFDLMQSQELQAKGVKRSAVDSVHLRSLTLTLTAPPSGQDLTFIDRVEFYAEAGGQPRRLIASGGPFQAGTTEVGLDVEAVDLTPYVTAPSMSVTTDVTGRRPQYETTVQATMRLDVDVNVSGVLCGT